jgi:ABC-type glycerol-3-phosphate transport system substrate-binding protein
MSEYAPPGALAADAMPEGFLTDQNVVAIIPEGETGYYLLPFVADPKLAERYRTVYNVQGSDGKGGLFIADPIAMASSCPNKEAAWVALKWLTMSPESQKYNFDSGGNLPVIEGAAEAIPAIGQLIDADPILNQNAFAEIRYPWAHHSHAGAPVCHQRRWRTMSPKQPAEQARKRNRGLAGAAKLKLRRNSRMF